MSEDQDIIKAFGTWNKQLMRSKGLNVLDIVREGKPPEDAFRMAVSELLSVMAHRVRYADISKENWWFPMAFPIRMTLELEQSIWDFELTLKLINDLEVEEDQC